MHKSFPHLEAPSALTFIFVHGLDIRQSAWSQWLWSPKLTRSRKMDDFSHLKVLLETPALTYQGKRGRERAVCPGEGEDAAEMRGCDGSGSTYK